MRKVLQANFDTVLGDSAKAGFLEGADVPARGQVAPRGNLQLAGLPSVFVKHMVEHINPDNKYLAGKEIKHHTKITNKRAQTTHKYSKVMTGIPIFTTIRHGQQRQRHKHTHTYESRLEHLAAGLLAFSLPECRVLLSGSELIIGFNLQSLTGAGVVEKQEWLLGQSAPVVCDLAKRQGWAIIAKAGDLVILPAGCMIFRWPMPGDTSADNGSPWGLGAGARLQSPGVYLVIFTIMFCHCDSSYPYYSYYSYDFSYYHYVCFASLCLLCVALWVCVSDGNVCVHCVPLDFVFCFVGGWVGEWMGV